MVSSDVRRPPSDRIAPRSRRDSASIGSMRSFIQLLAMPSFGWITISPDGSWSMQKPTA